MVAATGGFHGRTMGALAMTGQPAKQAPFEPLPPEVAFVPFGDVAALAEALDDSTAALVLEPIQGEGGVVPPPPGYLVAAQALAHQAGCPASSSTRSRPASDGPVTGSRSSTTV